MRSTVNKILLLVLLIMFTASALAALSAADELGQSLNKLNTMQAAFEQLSTNSKGKPIGEKIVGTLMLERPGKFRWEVTEPNQQTIIINGGKTMLYDADLEQLTNKKSNLNTPGNPATLLSSPIATIKKSFTIKKLTAPAKGVLFQLVPKHSGVGYQQLKMLFVANTLKSITILDELDNKTVINFSNIVLNKTLPTKAFVFVPPANTEIFNEE